MIDLHSHVLFGIDDGAESQEESIEMLKQAEQAGVKGIVCTPHIIEGGFETTREENFSAFQKLEELCDAEKINIKLYPGAENYLSAFLFSEKYFQNYGVSLNQTEFLLVELPMQSLPPDYRHLLDQLRNQGHQVIIAHPERNLEIIKDPEIVYRLANSGYLFQLDARSVLMDEKHPIFQCSQILLDANLIHCISSDSHSARRKHYLKFKDCYDWVLKNYDPRIAELLFVKNPQKIIENKEIERLSYQIPTPRKKGFLSLISSWFS